MVGQILVAFAGARLDSSFSCLRLIAGPAISSRIQPTIWADVGAQLDVNPFFVRGTASLGAAEFMRAAYTMAPGEQSPETEAYSTSVVGGYQIYWKSGWLALGGGWAWMVFDTLRTESESRPVYNTSNGQWKREQGGVSWVWRDRLHEKGPFGAAEVGFGLHEVGIGIVFEFGQCNGLGFNFQYRFL